MKRVLLFVLLIYSPLVAQAQQCNETILSSAPDDNYFANDNGTITELETGLTWNRCALGQRWNGLHCDGKAIRMNWQQAGDYIRLNDLTNWRIPQLAELASIVERKCKSPRINQALFPNTPKGSFWTINKKLGEENHYYLLDFDREGVRIADKNERHFVRLVSGRE